MRLRNILKAVAFAGALALSMIPSQAEAQTKKPQTSEQRGSKSSKAASGKASAKGTSKSKAPSKAAKPAKAAKAAKAAPAAKPTKKAAASGSTTKGASKGATKKAAAPTKATKSGKRPQRTASTQPLGKSGKSGGKKGKAPSKARAKRPCFQPAVEISRGFQRTETESFSLTFCDGKPAPDAIQRLSVLARPQGVAKPKKLPKPAAPTKAKGRAAKGSSKSKANAKAAANAKTVDANELVPGVRLLDEGLLTRLQKVVDHFGKKRIFIVSGYRPKSTKSYHQKAKALDFRVEGVTNEALVAFCRTLKDTGCGYYPNSTFVHMDVRPPKTGHVYWIDASGPGEAPRYVSSWPPPPEEASGGGKAAIAASGSGSDDEAEDESDLPSLMEALGPDLTEPRGMAPASELNTL